MSSAWDTTVKAVVATLKASSPLVSAVGGRIFLEYAEEDVALPYVTVHYMSGGEENTAQTRYADINVKVLGHADSYATAHSVGKLISEALCDITPASTGYSSIDEMSIMSDRYLVQNRNFFVNGGDYRVRTKLS